MTPEFFQRNRNKLLDAIDQSLVVVAGHTSLQRRKDAAFSFEQEANFWYLSGIESPDWVLVIEHKKSWLIAPEIDAVHQVFDGSLSRDEAKEISGVDEVLNQEQGKALLETLRKKHAVVATLGKDPHASSRYGFVLNPAVAGMARRLKKQFSGVEDCRPVLAKLRAIKQPEEINAIKRAINLTVEAFRSVRTKLARYHYEYEIEADFSHYFRSRAANGHAYDPIVASGKNACTLHYIKNNQALSTKDLILLDIGASVGGYAADITRTYAVGSPTARQFAVHAAVEAAHKQIIGLLEPGVLVVEYIEKVDVIMKKALDGLGLLKKPDDYRRYFPHSVSHGLGIDVHDDLGRPTEFQAGMVLTVEPGIYIPEEGIGVRIEDDILITKTGHENLSAALPTSL